MITEDAKGHTVEKEVDDQGVRRSIIKGSI